MKVTLLSKIENCNFEELFKKKGYAFFTKEDYNLNIIGIRAKGRRITNTFNDFLVLIYNNGNNKNIKYIYPITTDAGAPYMKKPINDAGCAVLVPGQYRGCYQLGLHRNKYKALVQRKPVKVYRDNNKNDVYDFEPKSIETGLFGINIHKAGDNSIQVDKWSAGCQVFKTQKDFDSFIRLCKKQIKNGLGKTFTYTLIKEEDLC